MIRDNTLTATATDVIDVDAEGAGIAVFGATATLDHSLVFGNTATATPLTPLIDAFTVAIARGGGVSSNFMSNVTLLHTVVHCNTVRTALGGEAQGGGFYNGDGSTAILEHSKVVNNTAEGDTLANLLGGGIYNANPASGSVTLAQTQVKDNHPDQCDPTGSVPGCSN